MGGAAAFLTGFSTGLGLLLAIGPQNAFVLRQGLIGAHVPAVAAVCVVSDALLIVVGVLFFRQVAEAAPALAPALTVAGALVLVWYGFRSLRSALGSDAALTVEAGRARPLGPTLGGILALTLLNPGVWLDTVVLLGSLSTRFPGEEALFGAGAATASALFFPALGFGSALLRPLFARPGAWRVLEFTVAITLWLVAARLLLGV